MYNDEELIALVRSVTPAIDDPTRVEIADWLDAHPEYQRTPVGGRIRPRGFYRWFMKTVRPRLARQDPWMQKRWCNETRIKFFLKHEPYPMPPGVRCHWRWADHGGFSVIAGRGVYVGEPYGPEEESRMTAALLHDWLGTPVTYDRVGRHGPNARRIVIWYDLCGEEWPCWG